MSQRSTETPAVTAAGPDLSHLDQHLGDVEVEGEIARTPLAAVYRVRTGSRDEESLALKVALQPCDSEELARFRHEVRLLSEARHPNVVEVLHFGVLPGGYPFLTMELLSPLREGQPYAGDEGWSELFDLSIQAAAGLAHIHRHGVIHHDLKPSNLALREGGGDDGGPELKILDFGLAQTIHRGVDLRIRGTLAYTAPEVILQDAYDQRADLYSLGLTLLELATGTLPTSGGRREALRFHLGEERPDLATAHPELPAALVRILERLLARDPARRFASAGRLLAALGEAAGRRIDPGELALGGTLLASRLVGRDALVARVRDELAAAVEGTGRTVLVSGAEGMGKSRLLREFRIFAAVEGARVGLGGAAAEGGRPLAPVLEALAGLGLEVSPPAPVGSEAGERGERYRVYREIAAALRREARVEEGSPLVLLLDDLHRSGPLGEELLAVLATETADLPVLILAAREEPEGSRRGRERRGGEPIPREAVTSSVLKLHLPALDRAHTAELVDACLGAAELDPRVYDRIHEHAGGVPGRVQQLLRHLLSEGVLRFRDGQWSLSPGALERWVSEAGSAEELDALRLERLQGDDRRLLEAASVMGEPFGLDEISRLTGSDPPDAYARLARLADEGYLQRLREAGGEVYALARRLRRRLQDDLDDERRRELHRRRASDLVAAVRADGRPRPARIAEHTWEAGDRAAALPYLVAAAEAASAAYAHGEAARLYGRAVEAAVEAGDAATEVDAAAARVEALRGHGDYAEARRLADALLDREPAGALVQPSFRARILLRRGRLHRRLGDHEAALADYRTGLEELAAEEDREGTAGPSAAEMVVELMRAEAVELHELGRGTAAEERAREALERAEALGLVRQRARLLNSLGLLAYARGDWQRAGELVQGGLAAAEELGTAGEGLVIQLRQNLGNVLWKTGDYEAAHRAYGENLLHCETTRDPWGQLAALNNLGILEASRGEWRQARDFLGRALEMTRSLGAREQEAMASLNLGEMDEMLGSWDDAVDHLERGLELVEAPEHPVHAALVAQLASLDRKRGRGSEALDEAQEALRGAEACGESDLAAQCHQILGLVAKDRDEFDRAAVHLERAGELADAAGTPQLVVRVRISQADLALRRRDAEAAREALAAARRLLDELPDRFSEAKLLSMEARLASLAGDEEEAAPLFVRSAKLLEELGTPYEHGRALYEWGLRTWNPELAGERLSRALRVFQELGADAEVRRTRGALERIQEHRRSAAGDRDPVLYEVIQVINSTLDLSEVLDRTMDLVLEHLRAERGMVVLFDPLTRELETAVSRNLRRDGDEAGELSESVVRQVIDEGEPVVTMDALVDQRFHGAESIVASHILSILCVPMKIRDRVAGAIYVDHTHSRGLFREQDVRFLVAFAGQAAVAIEKARLYGEQEAARRRLKEENEALKREILSSHHLGSLIGKSEPIRELKRTLERVAQSNSTVLIRGESGTGKGLVARIIHNISARREGPFVQFNCAALPETLVESELFGHEKGAFTGASGQKPGRFELAHGGTIFLDEVGKISRAVQAKLLRVVEDKRFERVGGTRTQEVDVRIVTATNLNLEKAIASDEFREDLYYRLNIIPIVLPPLRERREDIPHLLRHFLQEISRDLGQPEREIDPDVLALFAQHRWPGNVRELESAVHRALVLSSNERLTRADFAWIGLKSGDPGAVAEAAVAGATVPELADGGYQRALDRYDRRLVEAALERCEGRIRETARVLGIARNTLKSKMERYGIER